MARFPFVVALAYTRDETNHMADILLPDATDLESLQLIRIGGSKYIEQFWEHEGYALRQPVVGGAGGEARDFTDIATELARRTGLLGEYNASINRGAAGCPGGSTARIGFQRSIHTRTMPTRYLGRGVPRRQRRFDRRREVRRPRLVEGQRHSAHPAVLAPTGTCSRIVAQQDCVSSCPTRNACTACGQRTRQPAARKRACNWWDTQSPNIRRCRGMEGFSRHVGKTR